MHWDRGHPVKILVCSKSVNNSLKRRLHQVTVDEQQNKIYVNKDEDSNFTFRV